MLAHKYTTTSHLTVFVLPKLLSCITIIHSLCKYVYVYFVFFTLAAFILVALGRIVVCMYVYVCMFSVYVVGSTRE